MRMRNILNLLNKKYEEDLTMECDEISRGKISQLMDDMNTLYEKGKLHQARDALFKAWDILPENKYIYDESYWIVAFILDLSIDIHDIDMANKWVDKIFKCDLERQDDGDREMWAGKVAYESGKVDEAKKFFKIAIKKSEGRCFWEERNKKYLAVLKKL